MLEPCGDQMAAIPKRLELRPASESDCLFVWKTNNETSVRDVSLSSAPIPWESHLKWFSAKLNDSNTRLFIIEVEGDPAGVIRLDKSADNVEISVALGAGFRGQGYGRSAIELGFRSAQLELGGKQVVARVLRRNAASLHAFERAGFVRESGENGTVIRLIRG